MITGAMVEGVTHLTIAFNGCIETAFKIVSAYRTSRDAIRSQYWERLAHSLTMLKNLVPVHIEAIKFVCALLVQERNLVQAETAFRQLVENDDFPFAYDSVRGVLNECLKMAVFAPQHALVSELIARLRIFERAAFTIEPEEWRKGVLSSVLKAHAMSSAVSILPLIASTDRSPSAVTQINAVARFVLEQFADEREYSSFDVPEPLFDSSDEVLAIIAAWAEGWLQRSRVPLVIGKGLNSRIDALMFHQPTPERRANF